MKSKPKTLVIVGPTASGKSDLAVRLAKKLKGEVISADSRQVYKYLNAGTGKVTKPETKGVPHHLLDILEPKKIFTVSEYQSLANKALEKIRNKKRLPIIVGGTGFYIDAVTQGIVLPDVPPNKKLREKLEAKSAAQLFALLKKRDPERAENIDQFNKVRLVRALEIVEAIGHVPHITNTASDTRYIYIGLRPKDLETRIRARLLKRMPSMIAESKRLLAHKKLSYKRMQQLGLEYRYLALYFQKKLTKEKMIEELNTAIRQYAKRQMAWFKRNPKIRWFSNAQLAYESTLSKMGSKKQPRSR